MGWNSLQMRNMSSALSAASSACDHIRNWVLGTPEDEFVSMAVFSDGSYGAPKVGSPAPPPPPWITSNECAAAR